MGLLEIRFEGENDKDYRVRTRKGRTVIPEDHKIDAAHVSFEPTENLKRNNGERNLDFGRENYSLKVRFRIPSSYVDIEHFPFRYVREYNLWKSGFKEYNPNGEPIIFPIDDSYLKWGNNPKL